MQDDGEERFRLLFADTYGDVLRFAQRRGQPGDAEDVAAEVFLVAWRRLDDLPHSADDTRAWLFGVARHCLLNANRGQGRRDALAVRVSDGFLARTLDNEPDLDVIGRRIDLAAAWRRLSAGEQEVLALTAIDGLTSPQAAQVLKISAAAYRLRLMRARRELRRHLGEASPLVLNDSIQEPAP